MQIVSTKIDSPSDSTNIGTVVNGDSANITGFNKQYITLFHPDDPQPDVVLNDIVIKQNGFIAQKGGPGSGNTYEVKILSNAQTVIKKRSVGTVDLSVVTNYPPIAMPSIPSDVFSPAWRKSLHYLLGKYLILGNDFSGAVSSDGQTWVKNDNLISLVPALNNGIKLYEVNNFIMADVRYYNGSVWVTKLLKGDDNFTWTEISTNWNSNWPAKSDYYDSAEFAKMQYVNGKYFAIGGGGRLSYSTDLINWTYSSGIRATQLFEKPIDIKHVGWDGSQYFVLVNEQRSATNVHLNGALIFTSTDLDTWTKSSLPVPNLSWRDYPLIGNCYTLDGTLYVLLSGQTLVSGVYSYPTIIFETDGTTWTRRPDIESAILTGFAGFEGYANGIEQVGNAFYMYVYGITTIVSTDLVNWSSFSGNYNFALGPVRRLGLNITSQIINYFRKI